MRKDRKRQASCTGKYEEEWDPMGCGEQAAGEERMESKEKKMSKKIIICVQ